MAIQKAPNGLPYPDGAGKLMDTHLRLQDLARQAAPGYLASGRRTAAENLQNIAWRSLAVDVDVNNTVAMLDGFGMFTRPNVNGLVCNFSGWVEVWVSVTISGNVNGNTRQVGANLAGVATTPPTFTTYMGPFDANPVTISHCGVMAITQGQQISACAYQNSGATLLVTDRAITVRRLA